jgi:hypothetical protein
MTMHATLHDPVAEATETSMLYVSQTAILRLKDDDYTGVTIFSKDPALWEAVAAAALKNAKALR